MPPKHKDNLPEFYRPPEIDLLGIPSDLVDYALEEAAPAIRRTQIGELFTHLDTPRGSLGTKILISRPPYDQVEAGNLRSVGDDGHVTINFERHVDTLGGLDLFARATERELLDEQIEKQHELREQRQRFIDENPLGRAGLLLDNRFGGIDVDNPDLTAKHLIMRLAIARRANMGSVQGMTALGLVDRTIGTALGEELAAYFESVGKIADAVSHLPEEIRATTGPSMLEGAIELGRRFIVNNGERVTLAARIIQDPTFSKTVLGFAKLEDRK